MARQIIKQPNGKLAIWSSIVDNFIITDATPEEYIQFRIAEESERVRKDITEIVDKLEAGTKIGYYNLSWEEALEEIKERHGDEELKKALDGLEGSLF